MAKVSGGKSNSGKPSAGGRKGGSMFTGVMVGMIIGVGVAAGLAWFIMRAPSPFVQNDKATIKLNDEHKTPPTAAKSVDTPPTGLGKAAEMQPIKINEPSSAVSAASGVDDGKPRFDFYRVLADKIDATTTDAPAAPKTEHKKPPVTEKPEKSEKPEVSKPEVKEKPVVVEHKASEVKPVAPPPKPTENFTAHWLQVGAFPNVEDAEKERAHLALKGFEATVQMANIPNKGQWYRVRLGPYKNQNDFNHAQSGLKQNGFNATPVRAQ